MFGVRIECDQKTDKWYIKGLNKLNDNSFKAWMIDTLGVFGLVNENRDLQKHIMYEDIPSGHEYLELFIQAISERKEIEFYYCSFDEDSSDINAAEYMMFNPYGLRLFNRRWYVIGVPNEDYLYGEMYENAWTDYDFHGDRSKVDYLDKIKGWIYPLDRMACVKLLDSSYTIPPKVNVPAFFADFVGPYVDFDIPKERVVIKTNSVAGKYISTLPIHHSQKRIDGGMDEMDEYDLDKDANFATQFGECETMLFEYHLRPTHYFYNELLKFGGDIEVLEPESARLKMKEMAENILKNYKKD